MFSTVDFFRAADIARGIGSDEGRERMAPKSAEQLKLDASHAWAVREAFVGLFATSPGFDADCFRNACGPVAKRHYGEP